MLDTPAGSQHREICRILGTNASALAVILGKSRQTIGIHLEENRLFGVPEVIKVATHKIRDEVDRARVISSILSRYFPELINYTRDTNVERFSTYCIVGMYIQPEIIENDVFRRFVSSILSDEDKFVVFVCLPQKQYVQLNRWLEVFKSQREERTAQFVVIPCKLVELSPIQILAEPWSTSPKLIYFNRSEMFVDDANDARAAQLASALKEYGLSRQDCASFENEDVAKRLVESLNNSYYGTDASGADSPNFSPRRG
jgi:hypothetical protein